MKRVELWRAVHYTCQVLDALSHAHRAGVLHRDVKPSNILISAEDQVKFSDFGIASLTEDPGLTMTGEALGTLYYMSPEQMKAEPLDGDLRHLFGGSDTVRNGDRPSAVQRG